MTYHELFPEKSKIKIAIAIPSSILENCQDLRQKTEKLGIIARASAIFKIEEIYIYPHYFKSNKSISKNNFKFISTILNFLECPPYLRKRLYPISPYLKFSGLLPPLKISHHILKNKPQNLEAGEYREGVIVKSNNNFSQIDIGFQKLFQLNIPNLKINERFTLFVKKNNSKMILSVIDPSKLEFYWGYKVFIKDLKDIFKEYADSGIILTSKYGVQIHKYYKNLLENINKNSKIIVIFGAPFEGLHKIFEKKGIKIDKYQIFNFIPNQGTQTVTSEEAIFCTLANLNFLILSFT